MQFVHQEKCASKPNTIQLEKCKQVVHRHKRLEGGSSLDSGCVVVEDHPCWKIVEESNHDHHLHLNTSLNCVCIRTSGHTLLTEVVHHFLEA